MYLGTCVYTDPTARRVLLARPQQESFWGQKARQWGMDRSFWNQLLGAVVPTGPTDLPVLYK